jgi:hypothetical protein
VIPVTFKKDTAERFLDALGQNPGPLSAPAESWTADNLLMLAGVAVCILLSQGSRFHAAQGIDVAQMTDEQREAVNASLLSGTLDAVEWIAMRSFEVLDGEYDEKFEETHRLLLGDDKTVKPIVGFKNLTDRKKET